jgi:hypothetical protein
MQMVAQPKTSLPYQIVLLILLLILVVCSFFILLIVVFALSVVGFAIVCGGNKVVMCNNFFKLFFHRTIKKLVDKVSKAVYAKTTFYPD